MVDRSRLMIYAASGSRPSWHRRSTVTTCLLNYRAPTTARIKST